MVSPIYKDLTLYQGADFKYSTLLLAANGAAQNIAGYTFTSQLKISYYTPNVAGNLIVSTDAANGNVSISMNAATSANLAAGKYVYDLLMIDTSNTTSRLLNGFITVYPGVTNITPPANGSPAL